ncbi:MAG: hypothetical protein ACNI3C_00525 [Candidatus Marinarcus sp.]|uniref:hypothetical protein n=1 Tax=Candidatus Marinarcus sp. TaxID=3100987 RepID=UPI003AFFB6DB
MKNNNETSNNNTKIVVYVLLGIVLIAGIILMPKASFEKEKVESNGFAKYKLPDKTSLNSSMPTTLTWDDPYFQMSKSKTNVK